MNKTNNKVLIGSAITGALGLYLIATKKDTDFFGDRRILGQILVGASVIMTTSVAYSSKTS